MALWLFKQEPSTYSFEDLERDGLTTWDGIQNALALKHLANVRKGDRVFFYQTGKDRMIVGEMKAVSNPVPDPNLDHPRFVTVDVKPVRRFRRPVTLDEIKKDPLLLNWDLIRLARLSVIPVDEKQWQKVMELENQ